MPAGGRLRSAARWWAALGAAVPLEAQLQYPRSVVRLKECPDIDDPNGRWEGSRAVGSQYTLTCAPGFKVPGKQGNGSATLSCPENLQWPEDLKCENVDDCAKLEHGCGAFGVCTDLIDGYDCNCEQGYPHQRGRDGEMVCGNESVDEEFCGGHTCGAYGVCIDIEGNLAQFEQTEDATDDHRSREMANQSAAARSRADRARGALARRPTYRCECTDGFFDNDDTCVPRDCGELRDELGVWWGSTLFGGEYTLECPADAYIWGTALQRITVSCAKGGKWLVRPVCHSAAREAYAARLEILRFWGCLGAVALCICSAALAAGLTLGLATLEPFGLSVILATSPEHCASAEARAKLRRERLDAQRVLPLVKEHHQLLVTLLLFNTLANESLPVFLDELVPSWAAVLLSVSVVLVCGEILPSAVFTGPSQMRIAAACVPLVKLLQTVFGVVARPLARLLDRLIEQEDAEDGAKYSRAELLALLQLHGQRSGGDDASEGRSREEAVAPVMPCTVGSLAAASPSSRLLACCNSDEASESEAYDASGEEEAAACLAHSELQLINGALALREVRLDEVAYARLHQCSVAGAQHRVLDLVAQDVLRHGIRAVLVVDAGTGAPGGRWPQAPAEGSPCPAVLASSVKGCLQPRELLRGGRQLLGSLCSKPLLLVPSRLTALEALQVLRAGGGSSGVVVDCGRAQGVVTRSELLGSMLLSRAPCYDQASSYLWSGSPTPGRSASPPVPDYTSGEEYESPKHLRVHPATGRAKHQLGLRASLAPRPVGVSEATWGLRADCALRRAYTVDWVGPGSSSLARRGTPRSNTIGWSP